MEDTNTTIIAFDDYTSIILLFNTRFLAATRVLNIFVD